MKFQKILGAVFAAAVALSAVSGAAFAEKKNDNDGKNNEAVVRATMCFDNSSSEKYLNLFGDTEETGLSYAITVQESVNDGALCLSEDCTEAPADTHNTGIYFKSSDFGLENFAGCTLTVSIYPESPGADMIEFYSEGDVFLSEEIKVTANPRWTPVTLKIPDDNNNTVFGVLVTSSDMIKGPVCYVDNLCVYDKNGNIAENVGDYQSIADAESTETFNYVMMIIVFILLIVAVVGGVAYYIFKYVINRYR